MKLNRRQPHMLTATIIISFFIYCSILSKANILPHLSSSGSRFKHIDGLRGLAAVLVVCSHSWRISQVGFINDNILTYHHYNANLGAIGVQIFFCITGFLFTRKALTDKNINWNNFFLSRIKRLVPLYVLFFLLLITISLFIANKIDVNFLIQSLKMLTLGLMGSDYVLTGENLSHLTSILWTLPYEIKFYIALPALCAAISTRTSLLISTLFILIFAAASLYIYSFNAWVYFIIGGVTAFINEKHISVNLLKKHSNIIFIFSAIIIICSSFLDVDKYGYIRFIFMCYFFPVVVLSSPSMLKSKSLSFMGEISYSIYLIHILIIFLVTKFLSLFFANYHASDFVSLSLMSLCCLAICIICSLTFKYVEYPFLRRK